MRETLLHFKWLNAGPLDDDAVGEDGPLGANVLGAFAFNKVCFGLWCFLLAISLFLVWVVGTCGLSGRIVSAETLAFMVFG